MQDRSFFGHPRGLSTLFFTELWERFGYYGMRALLTLFLAAPLAGGGLGFTDSQAYSVYGIYTAMVYMVSLPGGWIADRILGQRKSVLYGGILIAIGYLLLAIPNMTTFFFGLGVVVAGTGLLKPNISTIVGQLYEKADDRRDSGFSIFYMGINLGAFIAPLICGWIGQRVNWHLGFATAGVGMIFGIATYLTGQKHLGVAGLHPVAPASEVAALAQRRLLRNGLLGTAGVLALLFSIHLSGLYPLTVEFLVNAAGILLLMVIVAIIGWMLFSKDWKGEERKRALAIVILFIASALFWSAFEQAGSSLNIFAQRKTDTVAFGFSFPASWLQAMNSLFIITLAGFFSWLWLRMGSRQPSSPAKFALALFFVSTGFVIVMLGAMQAGEGGRVSPWFLVFTYLCHTIGELLLSPVGLSTYTKLAPERFAGFMLGVWFLSISAGNYIGGRLAAFYGDMPMDHLFRTTAIFAFTTGAIVAIVARPVSKLMGGVR